MQQINWVLCVPGCRPGSFVFGSNPPFEWSARHWTVQFDSEVIEEKKKKKLVVRYLLWPGVILIGAINYPRAPTRNDDEFLNVEEY